MNAPGLAGGRVGLGHLGLGRVEDVAPAAVLGRQVDHGHDDDQVDQGVLDERDERRGAQPAGVGVGRQHREGDEQRQVTRQGAVATEADDLEDGLDADQLQGDVGHRRQDAGDRDRQRQPARAVAPAHEVGRGDVAVPVADRPQPRHEHEDDRVDHDRVGHGEEPADRAQREHRRGHRDERVRRVEVTAEQEPRDPRAEAAATQAPLVQALHALGPAPARGEEAHHGHGQEQHDQDRQGDDVDAGVRGGGGGKGAHRWSSFSSGSTIGRCGRARWTSLNAA